MAVEWGGRGNLASGKLLFVCPLNFKLFRGPFLRHAGPFGDGPGEGTSRSVSMAILEGGALVARGPSRAWERRGLSGGGDGVGYGCSVLARIRKSFPDPSPRRESSSRDLQ